MVSIVFQNLRRTESFVGYSFAHALGRQLNLRRKPIPQAASSSYQTGRGACARFPQWLWLWLWPPPPPWWPLSHHRIFRQEPGEAGGNGMMAGLMTEAVAVAVAVVVAVAAMTVRPCVVPSHFPLSGGMKCTRADYLVLPQQVSPGASLG